MKYRMKRHQLILFSIIGCSLLPATLQCSIKRSSTVAAIQQTDDNDSDEKRFSNNLSIYNETHQLELLRKHGLLDTYEEALTKYQENQKKLNPDARVQEVRNMFENKKSCNLSNVTLAIFKERPDLAKLLIDAGDTIDPMDTIRYETQLKMLNQKMSKYKIIFF